jgi:hypothetical protein
VDKRNRVKGAVSELIWIGLLRQAYAFYRLGLSHLPPRKSDNTTKAIAIHENAVWSVEIPTIRNTSPRMRKMPDEFLRFMPALYLRPWRILNNSVSPLQSGKFMS